MRRLITFLLLLLATAAPAATNWFNQTDPAFVQTKINIMAPGDTDWFTNAVPTTNDCTVGVSWTNWGRVMFTNVYWNDKVTYTGSDSTSGDVVITGDQLPNGHNELQRWSGLVILPAGTASGSAEVGIMQWYRCNMIRVDHCKIYGDRYNDIVSHDSFGVIDHCDLGGVVQPARIWNQSFLVPSGQTDGNGDYSWTYPAMWGSSNFFFFENCTLTNTSGNSSLGIDAYGGSRYELRYSTICSNLIGGHGTETTGRTRGTRARLIHNNTIIGISGASEDGHCRSGTYLYYSNDVWNVSKIQTTIPYRLNTGFATTLTPWHVAWGQNPWDSNDVANPYLTGTASANTSGTDVNGEYVLIDGTKTLTLNQYKGYQIYNTNSGGAKTIVTNSTTGNYEAGADDAVGSSFGASIGDHYQINRVLGVLDGPFMGPGGLISNSTPQFNGGANWPLEAIEPAYQWSNTFHNVTTQVITDHGFTLLYSSGVNFFNNVPAPGFTDYQYPHPLIEESAPASHNTWYAATNGSPSGAGSFVSPWDLATALATNTLASSSNHLVAGGDTIYVRGGVYVGSGTSFISDLSGGSTNARITVRNYPGELPRIDNNYNGSGGSANGLIIRGAYTDYMGFEIFNSWTNRYHSGGRPDGIDIGGNSGPANTCRVINCYVHDCGDGIGCWMTASNCATYGNICYNNGYQDVPPDRGHGHGFYFQNQVATGFQMHQENISFNSFDNGAQIYGQSSGANSENIQVEGMLSANSGSPDDTTLRAANYVNYNTVNPIVKVVFDNDFSYHIPGSDTNGGIPAALQFGDTITNSDITVSNCYLANGLFQIKLFTNVTVLNNTEVNSDTNTKCAFTIPGSGITNTWIWNSNAYAAQLSQPFDFNGTPQTFASWKAVSGFDATSTFSSSAPSANAVFVRSNAFEYGRAHVFAYNWQLSDNVTVDPSGFMTNGTIFKVMNAANPLGTPVIAATKYIGGMVTLPMTNLVAAAVIGGSAPRATGPQFNAFLFETTAPSTTGVEAVAKNLTLKNARIR